MSNDSGGFVIKTPATPMKLPQTVACRDVRLHANITAEKISLALLVLHELAELRR